jgi:hypothetical protein
VWDSDCRPICKRFTTHPIVGAIVASLLFTFHAIHVEAVASLVGRADLLSAAFFMLACILQQFRLIRSFAIPAGLVNDTLITGNFI